MSELPMGCCWVARQQNYKTVSILTTQAYTQYRSWR
nr:MAG TPA: hypothetical protein [Bacteriophage sp.]